MLLLNVVNDQNPRQIALEVLKQHRPGGAFIEDLLDRTLAGKALSTADRGLCQELVYGVVRWRLTLDWLIARKTNGRDQKSVLRYLLRLGLYQIFWLDRIPDHAAVHQTVELTRRNGFGVQAGFVNAVLRAYLREAEATRKLLAELKISKPAFGWSHPEWLVFRWQQRWGAEKTAQLLKWNNAAPKTFARVNTLKIDAPKLLEKWRKENIEHDPVRRDWLPEHLVFELKSHPPLAKLPSFQQGCFYIQDPSTLLAVTELNPQPGETILDYCAAPGGKTVFLAQLMNNRGRIVAQDVSEERLKLLQENCSRLGVQIVNCQLAITGSRKQTKQTSYRISKIENRKFDRILVDAPCSNSGVLRRRVDLRWRIRQGEISRLRQTQLKLLNHAVPRLKPEGVLVYSTCSLEPQENQEVVKQFLRTHKEYKLESERGLLPFDDNVDGAYVAKLVA